VRSSIQAEISGDGKSFGGPYGFSNKSNKKVVIDVEAIEK
jgi:hypothetical protein